MREYLTEREHRQMERDWREARTRGEAKARQQRLADDLVQQVDEALGAGRRRFKLTPAWNFYNLPEGEKYHIRLSMKGSKENPQALRDAASELRRIATSLRTRNPERPKINDEVLNWWPFDIAADIIAGRAEHLEREGTAPTPGISIIVYHLRECEGFSYPLIERLLRATENVPKSPLKNLRWRGKELIDRHHRGRCPHSSPRWVKIAIEVYRKEIEEGARRVNVVDPG